MSSRLTSLCDSPPSVLYGPGVFDNLRKISEESMALAEIYDITRNYNGFNFPDNPRRLWIRINKGGRFGLEAPVDEPPTSDATSGHSNFQASTTTNEVIRPLQPLQPPIRSPTRPSTLASTSTNIQPPVASTSRDPISPEPESIFDNRNCWNISGNFTDQKKANKKVVTSLFAEFDALTEVFVDKAMKSAIPGESTIAFAQEEVAYEYALVVKFRESLKKF
ncbi:hypothetical protein O181_101039 [Austropuccinia psidii MF-1]|uniref:Uncharacterized protein n=1 Tax=Austropuccinia psidii MF-1 TaxID=1389203 RepID=A0A9Q3JGE4_9BASI|nr:hypothetical protein [Austropuccinia psidii MF-1]